MPVNELRDELGVRGHVVAIQSINKKESLDECRAMMDNWERQGIHKVKDIPEGAKKQRFLGLLRLCGVEIDG